MTINIIILKSVQIMYSNYSSLTTVKIRFCFPYANTNIAAFPTCCPEMKIYNQLYLIFWQHSFSTAK